MLAWLPGSLCLTPWEVVGTDNTLTLDTPAYGATVASPVKIAVTGAGVDEYLQAGAHTLGRTSRWVRLLPAGRKETSGWHATAALSGARSV